MHDDVTIRTMTRGDLDAAVEWAAREGWNPGLDDAAAFFAADPAGFFVAERDGEMVGTISAVSYGPDFGFIGFYIVKPELRGHRHGLLLAEHGLAVLAGKNVGIDGVRAKQRQYAKFFGFQFAYRNIRFGGIVDRPSPGAVTHHPGRVPAVAGPTTDLSRRETGPTQNDVSLLDGKPTTNLVAARNVSFEKIAAYDRRFFPAAREDFLRAWPAMPHATSLAWVRDGEVRGYGVIRECREGFKIGPLFADNEAIATELFLALCDQAAGRMVFLDVPEVNVAAMRLAERAGMREVFATARMYNREIPALPLDGIFGVTTFELG